MNRLKGLVAISAFSLLILGLPAIASAQWNGGGYGGYGGNNRNLQSVVRNLKNRAESFERAIDRYDDRRDNRNNRGGWGNNNNYGGNLESLADQFKDATDDLEDAFGRGRNMNNSADEARRVLDIASRIDQELYNGRRGGGGNLQGQWNSMRQELDVLANAYGYNNGRNNRRNRTGGWRNNFPF